MSNESKKRKTYRVELGLDVHAKLLDNRSAFYLPANVTQRSKRRSRFQQSTYARLKTMDRIRFRIFDLAPLTVSMGSTSSTMDPPSIDLLAQLKIFSLSFESARPNQRESPVDAVCVATEFRYRNMRRSVVFGHRLPAYDVYFPEGRNLTLNHEGFFDVRYTLQTQFHLLPFAHDPEWIIDTGT